MAHVVAGLRPTARNPVAVDQKAAKHVRSGTWRTISTVTMVETGMPGCETSSLWQPRYRTLERYRKAFARFPHKAGSCRKGKVCLLGKPGFMPGQLFAFGLFQPRPVGIEINFLLYAGSDPLRGLGCFANRPWADGGS